MRLLTLILALHIQIGRAWNSAAIAYDGYSDDANEGQDQAVRRAHNPLFQQLAPTPLNTDILCSFAGTKVARRCDLAVGRER